MAAAMNVSISVIIPVYNEAPGLPETLDRFQHTLAAAAGVDRFEIVLVDDGSTDGAVRKLQPTDTLHIYRHPTNTGYGSALKTGIRQALYPVLVICDADGSYAIEELPKLLVRWDEQTLVVADRTSIPYPQGRWIKWILRRLLETWLFVLTYRWITDINSGFRVFSKARVWPFLPDLSDRFSFTTGQTLVWIYSKNPVTYIPTTYVNRKGTSKVHFIRDGIGVFKQTVRLTLLYKPIRLMILTVFAIGVLLALGLR